MLQDSELLGVQGKLLSVLPGEIFDQYYHLERRDVIRRREIHLGKYTCFPPISDKHSLFWVSGGFFLVFGGL